MRPRDSEKGLTALRLRTLLHYYPDSGEFSWRKSGGSYFHAGSFHRGYVRITIDGNRYLAHRLAFLYMTGEWPKCRIDHEDLNRCNNRWLNLREATDSENKANSRVRKDNKLQIKGVERLTNGKYRVRIFRNNRSEQIGIFDNMQDASTAYAYAALKTFGTFARAK